ncbi:hypothetical protein [Pyxidicoccus sp. MSG2]|uniref:hypothetical protein n=1 Tax=Pyxidicoccus sp. MSG2 TaxID=2996790 RepID=UPI00226E6823|nr:hypothetical protein [Pyxidicoccus sp. MSG2]MCY1015791.1 hypothetical protein [Pyxidicoccus sp. MSG2]
MNPHVSRVVVAAGLLTTPVLAMAREEAPGEETPTTSAPSASSRPRGALAMGMRGHSLSVAAAPPEAPVFSVDLEHPLMPHVTVFGGFHLGLGMDAVGLQAGSRLYVGARPYQGLFLSLQADATYFERNEQTSGYRKSVGGLLGYSQTLGEKWLVSLGAGADLSQTRSETGVPPTPECILFTPCLVATRETHVEEQDAVQPLVRLAAVYRF